MHRHYNIQPDFVQILSSDVRVHSSRLLLHSYYGNKFSKHRKIRSFGSKAAVITCGKDGAYYADDSEQGYVPVFKVDAVDTTGAGDVFHGAFATGLTKGWNLREIVTFSSAVSAIKCTKIGGRVGIPTFDEVMEFMDTQASG